MDNASANPDTSVLFSSDDLTVAAGQSVLLDGVNLHLLPGQLKAVVGPSGCGKTTLLRCLNGLQSPRKGQIRLENKTPDQWGWPIYRTKVLLLNQLPVLLDGSVEDNLRRPFSYQFLADRSFPQEKALALLGELGLEPQRFTQEARELSIGQQQRVCLIRALLLNPAVILMDEPTSALDPESVEAVERCLADHIAESQMAGLIVSHDRQQAERLCDEVIDLRLFCDAAKGQSV